MQPKIVPSSPKAMQTGRNTFEPKINLDYLQLNIGDSFQIELKDYKLGSVRMNAKRFMEKHPHIKLKVIGHLAEGLIEVARVPMDSGMNVGTEE